MTWTMDEMGLSEKLSGFWWCLYCDIEVPYSAVTWVERHSRQHGGCGKRVLWKEARRNDKEAPHG